jgi:GDP-L-fucose synthase
MRVLLTGGNGLLGHSIRRLQREHRPDWVLHAPTSAELDLREQGQVRDYFAAHRFDFVIHAAAKVGGIKANILEPVSFLADNLLINTHVIEAARSAGIERLLCLGSSCMYPKDVMRPLTENDVLTAPLEPTNEGYAISKIAAAKHCEAISRMLGFAYRTLIPCNLYGPDDHFGSDRSHLVAAALSKVRDARKNGADEVLIWGDGEARREFLYVDDLSRFILAIGDRLLELPHVLNVGANRDHTVNDYYAVAARTVSYEGTFVHDLSAPVGMIKKLMDSTPAEAFGWRPSTALEQGMRLAYEGLLAREKVSR